jgi:hypothetical protein
MSDCPTCAALETEIAQMRHELASIGRVAEPESLDDNDQELALARFLSNTHEADAAAGYRAGWRALARHVRPRLHHWQELVWQVNREGDRLRARVGDLLREQSRRSESG